MPMRPKPNAMLPSLSQVGMNIAQEYNVTAARQASLTGVNSGSFSMPSSTARV